jgi:hypothetical protein
MTLLRRRTTGPLFYGATLLSAACATQPRPIILSEVDAARQTGATVEAAQFAPQTYANAEQHRQAAEQEWKNGRIASSQIAAERALAGYEQTQAAARIARTERQLAEAHARVAESQKALGQLQAQLKQVTAEQTDLDTQVKIEQDAEALAPPKPASPEREVARRDTARALSAQARLLCAAARLLATPKEALNQKWAALDTLDTQLKQGRVPAPVDVAIRLRADCLHELTLVRRPLVTSQPQATAGDELFVKLSSAHLAPSRDERGIAVTYHNAFAANGLAPATIEAMRQLSAVIKQHPGMPLLVVVHAGTANPSRDEARGKAAIDTLKQLGADKADVHLVGDNLPLLDRHKPGAESRNERLEVVFVLQST